MCSTSKGMTTQTRTETVISTIKILYLYSQVIFPGKLRELSFLTAPEGTVCLWWLICSLFWSPLCMAKKCGPPLTIRKNSGPPSKKQLLKNDRSFRKMRNPKWFHLLLHCKKFLKIHNREGAQLWTVLITVWLSFGLALALDWSQFGS